MFRLGPALPETGVEAVVGQQRLVVADLLQPAAFIQDHYLIGGSDGGQAMGDDHQGLGGHQGVDGALNQGFVFGINRSRGFIFSARLTLRL